MCLTSVVDLTLFKLLCWSQLRHSQCSQWPDFKEWGGCLSPPEDPEGMLTTRHLHVAGADRDPASKLREINGRRCRVSESILQFAMQNDKADMLRQKQEVHACLCCECTFTLCAYSVFHRIPNKFHARVVGRFQMSAWKR